MITTSVSSCDRQELMQERQNDEIEEQSTSRLIDEYHLLMGENVSSALVL